MRARVGAACLIFGLVPAGITNAQLPAGYHEIAPQALPDSLREVVSGGRFTITVTRYSVTQKDRELIRRAESLMPPNDSIERIAKGMTGAGHIAALQAASQVPGERWWWRDWDGVLLPFALTGQAVAHYIERVRDLSAKPNPFAKYNAGVDHRANFEYVARATNGPSGAVEVQLEMKFSFYCGPLCALSFSHSRFVEFDATGAPIRIRGDGPPRYVVR